MQLQRQAFRLLSTAFLTGQALFYSCKSNTDSSQERSLSYFIDTVLVDSKDEILYLEYDLRVADFSSMDGMLYNFNRRDHSIEVIDMNRLEWSGSIGLQQEGPDGTGFWISDIQSMGKGELFLAGEKSGIHDMEGKLIKRIDWTKTGPENGRISDEEYFYKQVLNPYFEGIAFSLFVNYSASKIDLKKLDMSKQLISVINIDPNELYKKYALGELYTYNNWAPRVNISSQHDKVIVSHEFSNEFYVYYPKEDSLRAFSYSSTLIPDQVVTTSEGDLVNSTEDRIKALRYYLGQVSFGSLVWDSNNNKYYRFSSSTQFGEEERPGWLLPEISDSKVFLSIFDESFSLLTEMPIPELNGKSLSKVFVKDGMLWVYVNLEDEMGFIRVIFE